MLGLSNEAKLLLVCHCERDEAIRFELFRRVKQHYQNQNIIEVANESRI